MIYTIDEKLEVLSRRVTSLEGKIIEVTNQLIKMSLAFNKMSAEIQELKKSPLQEIRFNI